MADNTNTQVTVTGVPVVQSGVTSNGENWFLIDQSGEFTIDHSVIATVWLVGGGCDGEDGGAWNGKTDNSEGTGKSYGGNGGQGGYVFMITDVKIPQNKQCTATIALSNSPNGTSAVINGTIYICNGSGAALKSGGTPGSVDVDDTLYNGTNGEDGVLTPYGYVGSSGGGGIACDGYNNETAGGIGGNGAGSGTSHRQGGTDAENYGCGGGGGGVCGYLAREGDTQYSISGSPGSLPGGSGMQGCIIISYTIAQSTLVVQKHYKKTCNTHKTCNTDYYSNNISLRSCCGGSCGCDNANLKYADSLYIPNSRAYLQEKAAALTEKLRNAESENAALQAQADELQARIDASTVS